jgi:hypothetical protein
MAQRFTDYTIASARAKHGADGGWSQEVVVAGVTLKVLVRHHEQVRNPFNKRMGAIYRAELYRNGTYLSSTRGPLGEMTLPRILYHTGAQFHAAQINDSVAQVKRAFEGE